MNFYFKSHRFLPTLFFLLFNVWQYPHSLLFILKRKLEIFQIKKWRRGRYRGRGPHRRVPPLWRRGERHRARGEFIQSINRSIRQPIYRSIISYFSLSITQAVSHELGTQLIFKNMQFNLSEMHIRIKHISVRRILLKDLCQLSVQHWCQIKTIISGGNAPLSGGIRA